jgi:hypothetical protein
MGRINSRKSRARHFTPPPDLLHAGQLSHPKTPSRCSVLWAKAFAQKLGITISQETVHEVTGIAPHVQTRILASKQPRTLHNQPDSGPDPRGRKRGITRSETAAIALHLDDTNISLDDKGKPWLDITEEAGVQLPKTVHFNPPGLYIINLKPVQQACRDDEDIINAVCKEEKELIESQVKVRTFWSDKQKAIQLHPKD